MRLLLSVAGSVDLWHPLPAGAALAALPAGAIRRRPLTGLVGAALGGVGWLLSPVLGILGLSAGLMLVVRSGRGGKSTRGLRVALAGLLPPAAGAAVAEWLSPGSTGAIGWVGRRPVVLALVCAGVVLAGIVLRRLLRPALDPVRHATPEQRREVTERDGDRCNYCGVAGDALGVQLAMDHVIPWAKGGRSITSNFQLLCAPCNSLKSAHTDKEARRRFKELHGFEAGTFPRKSWLGRLIA